MLSRPRSSARPLADTPPPPATLAVTPDAGGVVTCPPPHEAVLPHAGLGHLHLQHTEHEVLSHDIKVPRKWMFWRYGSRHLCQEQVSPAVRLDGATLSVTAEKKGPEMPWMPETPGRCYVGCPRRLGTCVSPWT